MAKKMLKEIEKAKRSARVDNKILVDTLNKIQKNIMLLDDRTQTKLKETVFNDLQMLINQNKEGAK